MRGNTKVSLSPLLACTCTVMLGLLRSGSFTWIEALTFPSVGVHTGAAGGKVMLAEQLTEVLVEAVHVPVAGALTVPLPMMVMGMLTACVLPPGPLNGAVATPDWLNTSWPVPGGLGSDTNAVKLLQFGNKKFAGALTVAMPGAEMEQV